MITARGLGKRFGDVQAVRDLSFDVRPGVVTGFLGPNGAGKSTTMRLMLDLDRGQGETRFDGRRYRDLVRPLQTVGAVLEARSFHPTGLANLRAEWSSGSIYTDRVAHLTGTAGGLNNGTYLVPGVTVTDDGIKDVLTGAKGMDWFVAGATDKIDLKTGEQKLGV